MNSIEGRFIYGDDMYVDDVYMDERWSHINGFRDYMVSDKGRVWSIKNQKFLKIKPMDRHGHLGVCMYQDGKRYYKYIHRLVAEAFIPNPNKLPIVRHLLDEPSFNECDDLAWGTVRDNTYDSIKNGHAYIPTDEDRYKGYKNRMMNIIAIDIYSSESIEFESQGQASRTLKIPQANIFKVLHGMRKSAGGYRFEEVK